MSGITSYPYRMLCRKFGCGLAYLEMINARSLCYKNNKTRKMLYTTPKDRPLGVQLLGSDEQFILPAMEKLQNYKFDTIDFNAACPQKKITGRGEGASLLKTPKKLGDLLKIIVKNSHIPVTAKIRLGWDNPLEGKDIALYAQDAGIKAIYVHGRTKIEGYSGKVNYGQIQKIKKALKIPVIASGDIFNAALAKKMFDETGCDAILVARGGLGNPWIFKEISEFLKHGRLIPRPRIKEITRIMKTHLNLYIDFFGEKPGIIEFRKFFIWYSRGIYKAKPLRAAIMKAETKETTIRLIKELNVKNTYGDKP